MRLQKLVAIAGLCALVSAAMVNAQSVTVQMTLTVDNHYSVFAYDPVIGQYTLIGHDTDLSQSEDYTFTTVQNSYIYVVGRDLGLVAMFAAKTTFSDTNGTITVFTGVSNPESNWESLSAYRVDNFDMRNPEEVLNWLTAPRVPPRWIDPAVGRAVRNGDGYNTLIGAFYIWMPPGGGNQYPGLYDQWGFDSNLGDIVDGEEDGIASVSYSVLFRLQVVPEPASLLALGAGLAGLMGLKRRKR